MEKDGKRWKNQRGGDHSWFNEKGDWDRPNGAIEHTRMTCKFIDVLRNLGISTPNATNDADFFSWLIRSDLIDAEVGKKILRTIGDVKIRIQRNGKKVAEREKQEKQERQQRRREQQQYDKDLMRWADDGGRVAESFTRRLDRLLGQI